MARVVLDLPLPHLDHPFDYSVPAQLAEAAQPGVRVRVRFAGADATGYLIERLERTDHSGALTPLRAVVSDERVLTEPVLRLCRAVADRWAGTLADVLRLAIPPRHARTERQAGPAATPGAASPAGGEDPWGDYPAGPAFVRRVAAGQAPRAVWTALPGQDWADSIAVVAAAAVAGGRGAIVVAPDGRDLDALDRALAARLEAGRHVRLTADLGPAERYRAFLAVLRGQATVVIGNRAAAFAPLDPLGLCVIWDDGDDTHAEPRAPYPHAREVLALRAAQQGAALLVGGWAQTVESTRWLADGSARPIAPSRQVRRSRWPRCLAADQDGPTAGARLPAEAWRAVRDGLAAGPVLVQVPRAGYLPALACDRCRQAARCPHCHGPLRLVGSGGAPSCGWCGRAAGGWRCPECESTRLRARRIGVERTAEELGRAFPGAKVVLARPGGQGPVAAELGPGALVLATPGVEPVAPGGYASAVLLDGALLLDRPELSAAAEALRRWLGAARLVRPAGAGGLVVVCADPAHPAVQALIRWDPAGFAARELAERAELCLPPIATLAVLDGDPQAVDPLAESLAQELAQELAHAPPAGEQAAQPTATAQVDLLGPVPVDAAIGPDPDGQAGSAARHRAVLRAGGEPARQAMLRAVRAGLANRSARRLPGRLRVRIDPVDFG